MFVLAIILICVSSTFACMKILWADSGYNLLAKTIRSIPEILSIIFCSLYLCGR